MYVESHKTSIDPTTWWGEPHYIDTFLVTAPDRRLGLTDSSMLIPCREAFDFASGDAYIVVSVDNYGRETEPDHFICFAEDFETGEDTAVSMNSNSNDTNNYYCVYSNKNRMSQGMWDFM